MNPKDYLLEADGLDWAMLLADWEHLLPPELTVWFVNRFAEPIFVFEDGTVHRLDLDGGVVERLAESRDAFAAAADEGQNAERWFRSSEVDQALAAGLVLGPQECYGHAVPVVLGGACSAENTRVMEVAEKFAFLADVHRQIRNLPDGAQVRLRWR